MKKFEIPKAPKQHTKIRAKVKTLYSNLRSYGEERGLPYVRVLAAHNDYLRFKNN
jgi:hypothetical protein